MVKAPSLNGCLQLLLRVVRPSSSSSRGGYVLRLTRSKLLSPSHYYSFSNLFSPLKKAVAATFKIGRKHKAHRQEDAAAQRKPRRKAKSKTEKRKFKGFFTSNDNMGQDESRLVDEDTPSVTLENRSLEAVAQLIKDGRAKRIVVMVLFPSSPILTLRLHSRVCDN
jgi:hypothetical protein